MKLRSLHINHFGHFTDFDLSFGNSGLTVLYGENEAGKSTLLEFLRQVLFGFPERTVYDFGSGGEIGGRAELLLADNRLVELRRRKGRKNTVQVRINGAETGIHETGFSQLLGHADKEVFKSVFAFGLDELRLADKALSHESLQSALFGGGFGGALNPEKLLLDFDNQAGELFKHSASKPSINRLSKEIADLAKSVKDKTIRANDYEARRQEWLDAQQTADQLSREVADLRMQHSRTEKLLKALPLWLQRRASQAERDRLIVPNGFRSNTLAQFHTTTKAIDRLTRERNQLRQDISEDEGKLAAIQLDKTLLPLKSEIVECHGLVKSVEEARNDLPMRRAERTSAERKINATLKELRPGWSLVELAAFSLDTETRHAIEELNERRLALNKDQTTLATKRESTRDDIARLEDELSSLGESLDMSVLTALVEQSAEYTADLNTLTKELDTRAKLELSLAAQRRKLSPPLSLDTNEPQQLPVPPKELADQFDREGRDAATKEDSATKSLADEQLKLKQLELELKQLDQRQHDVPTLEELAAQRARRDEGWRLIRAQFLEEEDRTAEITAWLEGHSQSLPETYEQATARADQLADTIYEQAESVNRRRHLQEQIEQARQAVIHKQATCERVHSECDDRQRRWIELWKASGLTPLPPDAMRTWIDEHSKFVTFHDQLRHKDVEIDSLQKRVAEFELKLRTAFGNADNDATHLLSAAKKQVKSSEAEADQRKRLEQDLKRQRRMRDSIETNLRTWDSQDATWRTEWQAILQQLELPTDWNSELTRNVIARLSAEQAKLANLADLDGRIGAMELRLSEFDPRVCKLCEQLDEPFGADRPEVIAKRLHERLTEADINQQRRDSLQESLSHTRRKLTAKEAELADEQTRHTELLKLAEASSDAEFLDVAEHAQRAVELNDELARLTRDIELLRGNEDATEFETHLCESDLGLLQGQLDDLQTELTRRETAANTERESAGSKRRVFEELDGRDVAAQLQEEVARKQAQLASEIHRYVPLVFAKTLLQQAIKRFERENQPKMIGSISRLFHTMTGGRYVEIERPTSGGNAIYVRRSDGAERTPDQLSTGTREQLYLAIRLGYVLHYCQQSEPLPVVMDDVLVNFDAARARATLEAVREVSRDVQVLFFTCHRHFVDLIGNVFPDVQPIALPQPLSG